MDIPPVITQDTVLAPGVYFAPDGLTIEADGVTLDGNGATLVGANQQGSGVSIRGRGGVTVKNLRVRDYQYGIDARDCPGLTVAECQVRGTAEVPANTIFLDVWLPFNAAYGAGLRLARSPEARILNNDLQHQMVGMMSYHNRRLEVAGNNASYCSGWGFHLYETSDSRYENNCADYCCRWEPRGERRGHMGADAAGFLIVHNSSRNLFRRNLARLGGDGFFLAGMTPELTRVPCNDNRFEENDASWSPNIAFEATFSAGNVYANNYANHCNYGFWLGFSRDGTLEGNQVVGSRQAGIATEMGFNFLVRGNAFHDSQHGILLWSKHIPELARAIPENDTSHHWRIEGNTFQRNHTAVRIAANQDHGIRPYAVPEGEDPALFGRPHDHSLRGNTFRDNRIAIETDRADGTEIAENVFEKNVEGDTVELGR